MAHRGFVQDLHPTPEQAESLLGLLGVVRLVYNLALEQRTHHWRAFLRASGKQLSYHSQAAELTRLRAEVDFVRAQSQTAQQQGLRDLDKAFERFFKGISDYPTPRRRGVNDTARIQGRECPVRKLNAKWADVWIPRTGWVRFRLTRPIAGKILNVTVSHAAVGGWTVSFACEVALPEPARHRGPAVGIDRGVVRTLALSDGTFRDMPIQRLRLLERRRRKLQRAASRGRRGSNRNRRAKLRVTALHARIARVRRHWIHVTTRELADRFSVVVLERLKIGNMTRSARGTHADPGRRVRQKAGLNRAILEQGWGMTQSILGYKMEERGGLLADVPAMNTSRECPRCGHCAAENRESQAVFRCVACGFAGHADTVASNNVIRRWNTPSSGAEARRRPANEAPNLRTAAIAA